MKLYNLYEQLIIEETDVKRRLLTESVSSDDIIDAIKNRNTVMIQYRDAEGRGSGERYIKPEVYGQMPNGNYAIVAYQISGESNSEGRGNGVWRLFRVDRINNWNTKNMRIPGVMGGYNPNGSKKGNFMPATAVDTFSNIIYQYKPTGQQEPTQQEPVKPAPVQTKPVQPVQQAPAKPQVQAKPKPIQQTPLQAKPQAPVKTQAPVKPRPVQDEPVVQNNLEKEKI